MPDVRPAPYPANVDAKGWRFEIDYEQVDKSDTWPLAAEVPMAQHCLLMMWLVAWQQKPCGSFPDDETVIRAKCRIPPAVWAKVREVLLRGWWRADDGRLYHDTLVKRVTEMMARRRSDSDRQAARRAREAAESAVNHAGVTRDTQVSTTEVTPEFGTDHRLPTTEEGLKETGTRKRAPAPPPVVRPDDVDDQTWADWLALRKGKRAVVSETVITEARREAVKAGMTLQRFLAVWCARGSQGLQADWLKPQERASPGPATGVNRQEAQEQRNRNVADEWAAEGST